MFCNEFILNRCFDMAWLIIYLYTAAFDPELALKAKSVRDFDVAVTVPSFDWPDADTYYKGSSSKDVVDRVKIPMLVIQVRSVEGKSLE